MSTLQAKGYEFLLAKGGDAKAKEVEVVGARAALIAEFGKTKGLHIWRFLLQNSLCATGDRVGKQAKVTVKRLPYTTVTGKKVRSIRRKRGSPRRQRKLGTPDIMEAIRGILDRYDAAMVEIDACQERLAPFGLVVLRDKTGVTVLARKKQISQ